MRIATFNIENLDESEDDRNPSFEVRAAVLRPALERLDADILCLQEVHGQERPNQARQLLTLLQLLEGTRYQAFKIASTHLEGAPDVYDKRNLVTLIRGDMAFAEVEQIRNDYAEKPQYRYVTTGEANEPVRDIKWERPLLYTKITEPSGATWHVLNLHFKSRIPSNIPNQRLNAYTWKTAAGWAEGFFVSSMKRVGAALEARIVIDRIFDADPDARIVACGDFNADLDDVPVAAIRGRVEDTGNGALGGRVMLPCETSVPESARYSLYHHGRGEMLDHLLVSRALIDSYRGTEIHNETLHDESVSFAFDTKYPESDHAPVVASFDLD